jgi:hypothetical protein
MSLASRLPSSRPPTRPATPAGPPAETPPAPPDQGPPPGVPERRRHRRGQLSRWFTAPWPTAAIETGLATLARAVQRGVNALAPVLCVAALAWAVADAWSHRVPLVAPRDRAEALCFALASPPPFAPPMTIEPSAALVRGRFNAATPPSVALREVMHFDDRMVISEQTRRVGDYQVATAWLSLPGAARHWLVVGWMEGGDLAVCSFRFAGDADDLTAEESLWGTRLLARILVRQNFRAGGLPPVRLRARRDAGLPTFGPTPRG